MAPPFNVEEPLEQIVASEGYAHRDGALDEVHAEALEESLESLPGIDSPHGLHHSSPPQVLPVEVGGSRAGGGLGVRVQRGESLRLHPPPHNVQGIGDGLPSETGQTAAH